MTETIEAIFDGMIFRPLEPVDLPPNTRVQLSVSVSTLTNEDIPTLLRTTDRLNLEGLEEEAKRVEEREEMEKYIYENYVYSDFYNPEK